jgi:hypothetical protein
MCLLEVVPENLFEFQATPSLGIDLVGPAHEVHMQHCP